MTEDLDDENPPVSSSKHNYKAAPLLVERIRLMKPFSGVLAASLFTNYAIASMLVYGLTGFFQRGVIAGCLTVPISIALCFRDGIIDRENWYRRKLLRDRGKFEEAYRIKTVYDWSNYESELANAISWSTITSDVETH